MGTFAAAAVRAVAAFAAVAVAYVVTAVVAAASVVAAAEAAGYCLPQLRPAAAGFAEGWAQ